MNQLQEFSPAELRAKLQARSILLVDVREPQEYAAERIHGAVLFPLSTFDPAALPPPSACEIVFQCGSGKRSAMAVARCLQQGIAHTSHLEGGIQSWKSAGLPTVGLDADSGGVIDRR